MPQRRALRRTGDVVDECAKARDTRGGSKDTELSELAAIPTTRPSTSAATTARPVAKPASACLNVAGVTDGPG